VTQVTRFAYAVIFLESARLYLIVPV
jgi:hypothetical protein